MKVTVVVTAYNSPPALDDLVASLDQQTMPVDEFEVRMVDDGSSDGTFERLKVIASTRPNYVVSTMPNSGWPGRPRNVATAEALGTYVFFADHDDYLFPGALERMYDFADQHSLDVVHPKEVVYGWSAPGWRSWLKHQGRLPELDQQSIQCITPHKLYRRAFLQEHNITFPEGPVRLEDFSFNADVWARTEAIGVLADYPCYRWMIGDANSHKKGYDFDVYWDSFESSLAPILELEEGSHRREHLLVRWYRSRILERLAGDFHTHSETYQQKVFDKMISLLHYFPVEIDRHLTPADRDRSHLLRQQNLQGLRDLSSLDRGIKLQALETSAKWDGGSIVLSTVGTMVDGGGEPLRFTSSGILPRSKKILRRLPAALAAQLGDQAGDVTAGVNNGQAEIVIRHRETSVDWILPSTTVISSVAADGSIDFAVSAALDPSTAAMGSPLESGIYDIYYRLIGFGYTATHRIPALGVRASGALVNGRAAVLYPTQPGFIALDLDDKARSVVGVAKPRFTDVLTSNDGSVVDLARVHVDGDTELTGQIEVAGTTAPARLIGDRTGARLITEVPILEDQEVRANFGRRTGPLFDVVKPPAPIEVKEPAIKQSQPPFDKLRERGSKGVLLVGAYERDNFGDLLFALLTEKYLAGNAVTASAPVPGDMSATLGRFVPPYGPLLNSDRYDTIWSVGGELGRVSLGAAYNYALSPAMLAIYKSATPAERSAIRQTLSGRIDTDMAYVPTVSQFPLNRDSALVINSAGLAGITKFDTETQERHLTKIRAADHVSVRDNASAAMLKKAGIEHVLSPDMVHAISILLPQDDARTEGYLCFHAARTYLRRVGVEAMARRLIELGKATGLAIKLFVAGTAPGHDSPEAYRAIIKAAAGIDDSVTMTMTTSRSPLDLVDDIRRSQGWIGTSLHGRIISASYGVPRISISKDPQISDPLEKTAMYAATWDAEMPYAVILDDLIKAFQHATDDRTVKESEPISRALSERAHRNTTKIANAVTGFR